jgi:hypothetical protein
MPRSVLMRDEAGERVATEAELLTEQRLHVVLTEHPELIPVEDLGMSRVAVVGREAGLDAGRADLVLIDATGRLCIVEVKKEGNPDTRKVVAQLIDYASSLWRMSVEEFKRDVFHPYWRSTRSGDVVPPSLLDHLGEKFVSEREDEFGDTEPDLDLEQTLRAGRFRLVIAAPRVPPAIQRNIDYMNDQGMLLYGLEVNYFAGETECFVPRIVVKPRASEGPNNPSRLPQSTEATFLPQLDDGVASRLAVLLRDCRAAGARVEWVGDGVRILTKHVHPTGLAKFFTRSVSITVQPPAGYPGAPFDATAETLTAIAAGTLTTNGSAWNGQYARLADHQLDAAFHAVLELAYAVALPVEFSAVDPAVDVDFVRNDNNIWVKSAPELEPYVGRWLRGTLATGPATEPNPVTLAPLAGERPGWRPPIFESAEVAKSMWPPNYLAGDYRLTVQQSGTPLLQTGGSLNETAT